MSAIRVLIDSSGTVTCQSVMKGLRQQRQFDVEIVTVDSSPFNAGRYLADRWLQVPRVDDPGYLNALLEIVRVLGIRLFVPIFDSQFPLIAAERHAFEALGCEVAVSPPETVRIANEKDRTARFFEENGFESPRLISADEARAGRCRFPIILKPLGGRSSIGVERLRNPDDVDLFLSRASEPVILQEMAEGQEFTADVLCDLSGRPVAVVPRQRLETKNGVSTKGRTFRHDGIVAELVRMVRLLGVRGPANVQGFLQANGGIQWIEINPRFSGTLALTIASGVNTPLMLLRSALGEVVEARIGEYSDVAMLRYWEEVFVDSQGRRIPREGLAGGAS